MGCCYRADPENTAEDTAGDILAEDILEVDNRPAEDILAVGIPEEGILQELQRTNSSHQNKRKQSVYISFTQALQT